MQATVEKRSDTDLRDAVARQIEWAPQIHSQDISVRAKGGSVTLTGFVHSLAEKIAAEKMAKSVYGVQAVANDIEVKPTTRTDPEIARDIVAAIRLDVMVPSDCIKATIENAFVTLEGTVEWHHQREAAESCARNVNGVRGVIDSIVVKAAA
jgi:osmotically-inducible protein OsmY